MELLKNMYKFTNTDADISGSAAYKTLKLAEDGNLKEFKKFYKKLSDSSFGSSDLSMHGIYKLMGYNLNFKPFLKKFLVKYKYNNYYIIIYALNKNNIFDYFYISRSQIDDIIEYKK